MQSFINRIHLEELEAGKWKVTVTGASTTTHLVEVRQPKFAAWFPSGVPEVRGLLEESFRFLLEREPNTSILPAFELSVIERYFPEYPAEMRRRFA